jgi:hypothetical protein
LLWTPREDDPAEVLRGVLWTGFRQPDAPLAVTDWDDHAGIAALLAGLAGAGVVDREGRVVDAEAFVQDTPMSHEVVEARSGSRHTTVTRFSYDVPAAVVLVVSADGPVSLFSDGRQVLRLDAEHDEDRTSLDQWLHEDVDEEVTSADCNTCGTADRGHLLPGRYPHARFLRRLRPAARRLRGLGAEDPRGKDLEPPQAAYASAEAP